MSIEFGILTISDRSAAGKRDDLSGPALVQAVLDATLLPIHGAQHLDRMRMVQIVVVGGEFVEAVEHEIEAQLAAVTPLLDPTPDQAAIGREKQ